MDTGSFEMNPAILKIQGREVGANLKTDLHWQCTQPNSLIYILKHFNVNFHNFILERGWGVSHTL